MLRAAVSGVDSHLLELRVRQELEANPNDPPTAPPVIKAAEQASAQPTSPPPRPVLMPERAPPPPQPPSPSPPPPSIEPPIGLPPPGSLLSRMIARLAAFWRRHSRHHQLQNNISEVWMWAEGMADRVHGLSRQIDELRLQLSALGDRHRELDTTSRTQFATQSALHERLDRTVNRIQGDLRFEHRRLARLIDAIGEARAADQRAAVAADPLSAASELSGRFAQGFEERFRGPREEIKRRLEVHLDRVRGQRVITAGQPLLDIGCGRGEWLELLAEAGINAYGIDANPHVVDACQRRGLVVRQADAIGHLAGLPERALGAISAFHVIEHLSLEDMLRLIDEARRTLMPEGLLLLETPNPENLKVGALTFHYDPTHRRPVPPLLLEYLVASRGFDHVEVMRLHPYPDSSLIHEDSEAARRLNELVYGPQDTAVFARRL